MLVFLFFGFAFTSWVNYANLRYSDGKVWNHETLKSKFKNKFKKDLWEKYDND